MTFSTNNNRRKKHNFPHQSGIFLLESFPTNEASNGGGLQDTRPLSVFQLTVNTS